eukprot:TRINITY_DN12763_c0_g1_i3.p1 TRINITY_DN12763_c0_g1~~TRINITY_DN12763_c0_g1_i3.p1  ORF type:complete len:193 (-),score=30.84 TRINITY_DN12763_c0_g1_i3:163-741(-)
METEAVAGASQADTTTGSQEPAPPSEAASDSSAEHELELVAPDSTGDVDVTQDMSQPSQPRARPHSTGGMADSQAEAKKQRKKAARLERSASTTPMLRMRSESMMSDNSLGSLASRIKGRTKHHDRMEEREVYRTLSLSLSLALSLFSDTVIDDFTHASLPSCICRLKPTSSLKRRKERKNSLPKLVLNESC